MFWLLIGQEMVTWAFALDSDWRNWQLVRPTWQQNQRGAGAPTPNQSAFKARKLRAQPYRTVEDYSSLMEKKMIHSFILWHVAYVNDLFLLASCMYSVYYFVFQVVFDNCFMFSSLMMWVSIFLIRPNVHTMYTDYICVCM